MAKTIAGQITAIARQFHRRRRHGLGPAHLAAAVERRRGLQRRFAGRGMPERRGSPAPISSRYLDLVETLPAAVAALAGESAVWKPIILARCPRANISIKPRARLCPRTDAIDLRRHARRVERGAATDPGGRRRGTRCSLISTWSRAR